MRVGSIRPIRFVPYKDVKMLLRYFSLKGVVTASSSEQKLSKVNTLLPYESGNLEQEIFTRNSLNKMVVDTLEKNSLDKLDKNKDALSNKTKIEVIKAMNKVRKGVKINTLDYIKKSKVDFDVFGKDSIDEKYLYEKEHKANEVAKNLVPDEDSVGYAKKTDDDVNKILNDYTSMLKKKDEISKDEKDKKNEKGKV